jgi:hypoxanthine phosphoribosyltransferase
MLEIRSLLAQNKVYEDVIKLKEKENKQLHDDLKTIENRWKNNSKEAHKFTAKPIL